MISRVHPFPKDVEPVDRINCLVLPEDIPNELKELFTSALQNDPLKRPQTGMEFAQKLQSVRDKLPTFAVNNRQMDYMSLSEIATALVENGLSSEESMSVQLLSGGLRELVGICIEEKKTGQDWLPTSEKQNGLQNFKTLHPYKCRYWAYSPFWENQYHWLHWLSRLVATNGNSL